ncbi:unnamed protein product, partial [Polarella glacialis]
MHQRASRTCKGLGSKRDVKTQRKSYPSDQSTKQSKTIAVPHLHFMQRVINQGGQQANSQHTQRVGSPGARVMVAAPPALWGEPDSERVAALEQQAEIVDLRRSLEDAAVSGRRQEQRFRQQRASLREVLRQLEEVEQRVDGVQRRVEAAGNAMDRLGKDAGQQDRRALQLEQTVSNALLRSTTAAVQGKDSLKPL